jgi:NAD(P)H dehydrogenase (quinone)
MAEALSDGAREGGAEVRLRRAHELAPEEIIRSQDAWHEHYVATRESVSEAAPEDLEWADGYAFGTPTRFGLPSAQLKQFIDQCGPLWVAGKLADKVATSFTSSQNRHGGQESTILALNNVFYHWGAIIVPTGYTDPLLFAAGGNPYGASYPSGQDATVSSDALQAARYQGRRLADFAKRLGGARVYEQHHLVPRLGRERRTVARSLCAQVSVAVVHTTKGGGDAVRDLFRK